MANNNGDTWSVCYGNMEQLARDNAIETNCRVFYPGRSDRLVPGCAYHCCNGSDRCLCPGTAELAGVRGLCLEQDLTKTRGQKPNNDCTLDKKARG